MTDLMDLLDSAAGHPAPPTPGLVADDVRRGRRALLHRRWAHGSALVLTAAAALAAVVVAPGLGDSSARQAVRVAAHGGGTGTGTPDRTAGTAPAPTAVAVPLVPDPTIDKAGRITAQLVPAGWREDATEFALLLAPSDVTTGPDDFAGKLLVMVAPDQTPTADARPVRVGGAAGTLSTEGGTAILIFTPAGGRQVVVQAPETLGWDEATLLRFAEGLAVSSRAKAAAG